MAHHLHREILHPRQAQGQASQQLEEDQQQAEDAPPPPQEEVPSLRSISNRLQSIELQMHRCHTLISSGDHLFGGMWPSLDHFEVLGHPSLGNPSSSATCRELKRSVNAQSVKFRNTPEIKWNHRCIIKWDSVTVRKSKRGWLCNPQGSVTLRKENKYRYEIRKFP